MLLTTEHAKTAMLHVSWTQWKNLFSFEVFGPEGFVSVDGLGGSYGQERLTFGKRRESGGVPEMQEILYKQPSETTGPAALEVASQEPRVGSGGSVVALQTSCWDEEWAQFILAIEECRLNRQVAPKPSSAVALDGCQNLKIVDAVYRSSKEKIVVDLNGESNREFTRHHDSNVRTVESNL